MWALCAGLAVVGACSAVWALARQAYLTEVMPFRLRGRAMSTLGGMQRVGTFVGPFLTALATGAARGGRRVLAARRGRAAGRGRAGGRARPPRPCPAGAGGAAQPRMATVVRRHLPVFRTLGVGSLLVNAVRTSRQVVLPLWADHVGLGPAQASLLFGLSGAMEVLMFYPGGLAMDRFGRRWVVTVSMGGLGAALVLLPAGHHSARAGRGGRGRWAWPTG